MKIYKLLHRFSALRSSRLKLMVLWVAHISKRRVIGIFLDPVLSCNLRCKMCYFSDPNKRPQLPNVISDDYISQIENSLFKRALKLQIGCAAEPTLFSYNQKLISRAKQSGIPYISFTTNGQLLDYDLLKSYLDAGLDEVTLSLHGTKKETYEWLMQHAKYENLLHLINNIIILRNQGYSFVLRVNFTMNQDNFFDLKEIFDIFPANTINILQLRPIQKLGDTSYNNFDISKLVSNYDDVITPLIKQAKERNVSVIVPTKNEICAVGEERTQREKLIEDLTYCYVSSSSCYHADFDIANDTYSSYHKRIKTSRKLIKSIFKIGKEKRNINNNSTKKLNYSIK